MKTNRDMEMEMISIALPEEKTRNAVVVSFGLDDTLFVFRSQEWTRFGDIIQTVSPVSARRTISRFFFSSACDVEVDAERKICVPRYFTARIGIPSDGTTDVDGCLVALPCANYLELHPDISDSHKHLVGYVNYIIVKN